MARITKRQSGFARLRLLMVTFRYLPFMGGVELHVDQVARRLAARGVDITILTTDPTGTLPVEEHVNGFKIKRVRAWPANRDYYFAPRVYTEIVRGDWDIVHAGRPTTRAPSALSPRSPHGGRGFHTSLPSTRAAILPVSDTVFDRFSSRAPASRARRSSYRAGPFRNRAYSTAIACPPDRFALISTEVISHCRQTWIPRLERLADRISGSTPTLQGTSQGDRGDDGHLAASA